MKRRLFEFTPLGKADKDLKEYLGQKLDEEDYGKYQRSLVKYREIKVIQGALKILLYASIVTSIAATLGFKQVEILQKIASYIGTSLLFVLYTATSYLTMIRKESYYVQREILISRASG